MVIDVRSVLRYATFPSRIGMIGLAATQKGVCRLDLNVDPEAFGSDLESRYGCVALEERSPFTDIRRSLDAYLDGTLQTVTCPIDVIEGTTFQQRVWQALLRIPWGQVRSYAWVARAIGRPRAARAVGGATARNPIAIIVPCHRVVRSDGQVGGYGGGSELKRELLRIERVAV